MRMIAMANCTPAKTMVLKTTSSPKASQPPEVSSVRWRRFATSSTTSAAVKTSASRKPKKMLRM